MPEAMTEEELDLYNRGNCPLEPSIGRRLVAEVRRLRSALSQAEAAHGEAVRAAVAGEKEACAEMVDERAAAHTRAADSWLKQPARDRRDEEDYTRHENIERLAANDLANLATAIRSRSHPVPDGV